MSDEIDSKQNEQIKQPLLENYQTQQNSQISDQQNSNYQDIYIIPLKETDQSKIDEYTNNKFQKLQKKQNKIYNNIQNSTVNNTQTDTNYSQSKTMKSKKIEYFSYPTQNLKLAQIHQKAKRVGKIDFKKWGENINNEKECCQCYPVNNDNGNCISFLGIAFNYKINAIQSFLNFVAIVASMIYLIIISNIIEKGHSEYSAKITGPQQYTLMAYNINPQLSEDDLKSIIAKKGGVSKDSIVRIVYTYKIRDCINALDQKALQLQKKQRIFKKINYQNPDMSKIEEKKSKYQNKIESLEEQIFQFEQKLKNPEELIFLRTHIAFITFQDKCEARKCYENCKFNILQKGAGVDILMILISFAIVAYLTSFQISFREDLDRIDLKDINLYYSLAISLCIALINIILSVINEVLVKQEKHNSFTSELKSNASTLSWMEFSTMGLVPSFLFLFKLKNYTNVYMLNLTFFILLSNTFIIPFLLWINVPYLIKKLRQKRIAKQIEKKHCNLNQLQVNEIFEDPSFQIDRKYSGVNATYLLSMFCGSFFPMGLIFGVLCLIFYYWTSKYNFINRSQISNHISNSLHKKMMYIASTGPLFYTLGNYISLFRIQEEQNSITMFIIQFSSVIICIAFIIFRKQIKILCLRRAILKKKTEKQFTDIKQRIGIDYDIANPIIDDTSFCRKYSQYQQENETNQQKDNLISTSQIQPQFQFATQNELNTYITPQSSKQEFNEKQHELQTSLNNNQNNQSEYPSRTITDITQPDQKIADFIETYQNQNQLDNQEQRNGGQILEHFRSYALAQITRKKKHSFDNNVNSLKKSSSKKSNKEQNQGQQLKEENQENQQQQLKEEEEQVQQEILNPNFIQSQWLFQNISKQDSVIEQRNSRPISSSFNFGPSQIGQFKKNSIIEKQQQYKQHQQTTMKNRVFFQLPQNYKDEMQSNKFTSQKYQNRLIAKSLDNFWNKDVMNSLVEFSNNINLNNQDENRDTVQTSEFDEEKGIQDYQQNKISEDFNDMVSDHDQQEMLKQIPKNV
ncbi:hypothetical protein PPERSA_02345 [Pseudocohnilembus persalinus]|uniref:CSC1/OSCA1-like cytosolic domain-containing protein n=1 Tax=Pseudocohnilembus persalinus TaxID=266149 RepID=A0A0V0QVA3_PSEPJ|nr:hypothetical protein PPERSA_02345 [Pseudocohnilembus persalinus]|eukprot:KRX05813.1 hypothetical protein PPERSA_02345 [Pseudocohnilembus persalinus]